MVQDRLDYDPFSGVFTWKTNHGYRFKAGDVAGTYSSGGYREIQINGTKYRATRLAYLLMTGEQPDTSLVMDHINRERCDDRWENLRLVSVSVNNSNKGLKGLGYCYDKHTNRWLTKIGGRLLSFLTEEGAAAARWAYLEVQSA